jgi:uncharacterized membrane protein
MTEFDQGTPPPPQSPPSSASGFDFNGPTIVSLLYLANFVLGISALVGVVLAYIWKGEARPAWEVSHYQYQIRTFWIAVLGSIAGVVLLVVLIGIFVLIAVGVLVVVRTVLSLIAAQKREPMPNPESWLV